MSHIVDTPFGQRGTGLVPAPFNPRSLRYRLIPDPTAVTIDWNAAPSLRTWLTEVEDQGQEGSCVAHACTSAVEMLRKMRDLPEVQLCRNWVYWKGRIKAGLIHPETGDVSDTGMWAEAGFDVMLGGAPKENLDPYIADPRRAPPASLDADAPNQDDLLSHRPIFRDDPGGLAGGVIVALQAYMPVTLGMLWRSDYGYPDARGILPDVSAVGTNSAHEVLCWARIPAGVVGPDWYAVCRNSWSRQFTEGRQFPQSEMEPGDFLIPGKRFDDGTIIDARAASYEPIPQPAPTPDPTPKPTSCRENALALVQGLIDKWAARRSTVKAAALREARSALEAGLS